MCRSEGTVWGGCEQKSWTDVKGKKKRSCTWTCCCSKTKAFKTGILWRGNLVEIRPPVRLLVPLLLHWGLPSGAETQPSCSRAMAGYHPKQDASHIETNPYLHSHSHSGPIQCCQFGVMRTSSDCTCKEVHIIYFTMFTKYGWLNIVS